ncbi:carbon-nitrogen family hydrolase (macronuclear) [Tetrahymena thermophila SB210]|uniref:Carbon-nitrogen family hydrolase n=1 Tax=Tetrahymena thermophila (strain SB210) TaxID=312017 RepID=Q23ND3_TETTS|nr:carbon-nitrogen family hydrolase [Tetrahymena thermophila SB210]EAR98049.1 carbon-nitrogen family hydrolase [Tetrahymena thermophila SB210]|eukprot:XP_001018294.1 carbon-nitrogen family hydrolase [Tetrahymena thermophila SB210]
MNQIRKCLVGVVQMCSTHNKKQNMEFILQNLKQAHEKQAKICFFPEAFAMISRSFAETFENAEYIDGEMINCLRDHAKKYNLWLSLGGFQERLKENDKKMGNTHIIIDNLGNIVQTYKKLHLFDISIDTKNTISESSGYVFGDQVPNVVDSPAGRLGLSICYDLRFPELFRLLAVQQKAEILLVPSAFFKKTGQAHWHTLLKARAIENQCFVIAAAQAGQHNDKRESYGHSLVIDPWGEVLLDMGPEKLGIDFVEIDLEKIDTVRKGLPAINHIRNDIYKLSKI